MGNRSLYVALFALTMEALPFEAHATVAPPKDHVPGLRDFAPAPKQKPEETRVSPKFLIDDLPTTKELAGQLLLWEASRLKEFEKGLNLTIPDGLSLAEKLEGVRGIPALLAAAKNFSLAHQSQLIALLRAANEIQRGGAGKPLETVLREQALAEVKAILRDVPNGKTPIPKEVRKTLRALAGGRITPEKVREILENPKAQLSSADLVRLLGAFRIAGAKQRGQDMVADFRADAFNDAMHGFRTKQEEARRAALQAGRRPPSPPPSPFAAQWPDDFARGARGFRSATPPPACGSFSPGGAGSGGSHRGGQGFEDFSPGDNSFRSREGNDGSVVFRGEPHPIQLRPGSEGKLLSRAAQGSPALETSSFYDSNMRQYSKCQGTVVKKKPAGDSCEYDLATAEHCVIKKDGGPRRAISQYAVAPFGWVDVVKGGVDTSFGGDFAMVTFRAKCMDVPVVPLAASAPRDGEGIVVHTVRKSLVGQATETLSGNNSMQMSVRHDANSGLGIYQGDSGGPVVNDKGELVGVISSKLVGDFFHGIGFFASKGSLLWANRYVNPSFVPPSEGLLASTAPAATH